MSDFNTLGLHPKLAKKLAQANFQDPTPIQRKSIPLALQGYDILGLAQTGTGKTLAFGLPMIDLLMGANQKPAPKTAQALILAPTRELINQIAENLLPFTKGSPLKLTKVVGGQPINRQIKVLSTGVHILAATPGRLIDLMDRRAIDLSSVQFLVLDEADQMLDMGFVHALRKIAPQLGTPRQTMLFSATMPKKMEEISKSYLTKPKRVEVAKPGKTADKIKQSVTFVEKSDKPAELRKVLARHSDGLVLVFARTKHGSERMKKQLVKEGFDADSIHGNKSQNQRDRALKDFRNGRVNILVATDVAARGIDIPDVACVINYDLPNVAEAYVHRIGRTARAGREGVAVSFCSTEEHDLLRDIQKLVDQDFGLPAKEPQKKPGKNAKANTAHKPSGQPAKKRNRRRRKPKSTDAKPSPNLGRYSE